MTSPTTPFLAQSPELAARYQEEAEKAIKRYNKALQMMTDPPEVPVGKSPKEVVWTFNKAKLYHYLPPEDAPVRYPVPLLMVYALINKPYVMDLRPGASLVEYLVGQGFQVYLLDWGTPGPEDAGTTIDDYVLDYLPKAARRVLRHSGASELSVMGYCIGAVLTSCFVALHQSSLPIRNMVLMAGPIDFSNCGLFQKWLDPKYFNVNQLVQAYGNVPGEIIDFGSKLLKPVPNFVSTYTGAFDKLWDDKAVESWLSMQKWVNDGVPFAGAAFKQWITEFYQSNKLTRGELKLRGRTVRLQNITANLFNIIAEQDHIALPEQSKPVMELVGSKDKEQIILPAGHVGLMVGRSASKGLWPALNRWLAARSA